MLGLCSGCSAPDGDLPVPYRRVAVPVERLADPAARARGRALFLTHCAICHGERADGRGRRRSAMTRPPADLSRPEWRRRTSPRRLFFVVREGLRGTPMPAWKGTLDADQTWDVVAYLRSLPEDER
jgi:mono/diheme cytochrome c family protein